MGIDNYTFACFCKIKCKEELGKKNNCDNVSKFLYFIFLSCYFEYNMHRKEFVDTLIIWKMKSKYYREMLQLCLELDAESVFYL